MGATPAAAMTGENSQASPQRAIPVQSMVSAPEAAPKPAGFGLPCAKCRTYYAADLKLCPVCKSAERIAVAAVQVPAPIAPGEQLRDPALLEQERERFLREFKAQLVTLQTTARPAASSLCMKEENHLNAPARAAICLDCYDHLQERVDMMESALRMDLKEAAQIVYDAVWADPSDPDKTYENAANALLSELRKRSGVPHTFALLQPPMTD
jgi:hypothetical protein